LHIRSGRALPSVICVTPTYDPSAASHPRQPELRRETEKAPELFRGVLEMTEVATTNYRWGGFAAGGCTAGFCAGFVAGVVAAAAPPLTG
jgi:hypothetical protein